VARAGSHLRVAGALSTLLWPHPRAPQYGVMTSLAVILILIGIALLLVGIFVEAAKFLLWVGLVIVIIAVIAWLLRSMRRNT